MTIFLEPSSSCTRFIKLSPHTCGEVSLENGLFWCKWFNDWCWITGKRKEGQLFDVQKREPQGKLKLALRVSDELFDILKAQEEINIKEEPEKDLKVELEQEKGKSLGLF